MEAPGEGVAVPFMAGIAGFHRLAVFVEQAPIEIETIGLMPTERPVGAGKTSADGAGGIETDQIQTGRGAAYLFQDSGGVRQRLILHMATLPGVVIE